MYNKANLESELTRIEASEEVFELYPPFTTEFTSENPEFATTTIMPPYLPAQMISGHIVLKRPQ
jgi:hypothetical protein